jgi:hypothetical protein
MKGCAAAGSTWLHFFPFSFCSFSLKTNETSSFLQVLFKKRHQNKKEETHPRSQFSHVTSPKDVVWPSFCGARGTPPAGCRAAGQKHDATRLKR